MEAWKMHGFIHSGSGVETGGEEEQWERKERGKHETQTGRKENSLTKIPSCAPIQPLLTSSHRSVCIVTRCLPGQVSAPVISAGDCGFTALMSIPTTATACQHVDAEGCARLSSCRWAQGYLPHVDKWVQVRPTYKPRRLESKLSIIPPRCPHPTASLSQQLARNPAKTNRWFAWQGQL